jgi:hypothetical protein
LKTFRPPSEAPFMRGAAYWAVLTIASGKD